ncbi:MAG: cellulase family glycosylhydrolase [Porcipelethomonas sp.]
MSIRKKILSFLTSAVCMVSCICAIGVSDSAKNNVEAVSLSGQSARDITSQMKIGWNLGNSLDATGSSGLAVTAPPEKFVTSWGNPAPTKELIQTVHNGGFNTIRIPTTWYQHLIYNAETDMYEIEDSWMNYVKQTVDYAYSLDMFVILNVHHEDWVNVPVFTDDTLAVAQHKLADIWTQVSEEFADYDQHLIFEGMNEPRQTGNSSVSEWGNGSEDNGYSWNYINTLNETFINTVRSQGSAANNERLLMIPGYVATSDTTALNNVTIPGNSGNVALSVHAYAPYFFTMDTSSYANHQFPGKSGWGEDYDYHLRNLFNSLKSVSDSKGLPIIIGEFSASDFENTSSRVEWAKAYLTYAKNAGIPCVLWDNNVPANGTGEAHGYVYRLTNTWYPNSIDVVKAMMDTLGITGYVLPEYREYQRPVFSWDSFKPGDDWIEIYRSENGTVTEAWGNVSVSDYKQYISENYMFAMVSDSETEPCMVIQGGWYKVFPDESLSDGFVTYYTYDAIKEILETNNLSVDEIKNLYMSASSSEATFYGLYAVPVGETGQIIGDIDGDGEIRVVDAALLSKYLLGELVFTEKNFEAADINKDGVVNCFDYVVIKRMIIYGQ